MSRLVVVSNRVAAAGRSRAPAAWRWRCRRRSRKRGGLWFGWSGKSRRATTPGALHEQRDRQHPLRHHRPVAARPRRLLQRLRQPHAVAAAALPHRPGRLQPRDLRRLSPGQRAVRREAGAAAARRRPGLGARLPPDPAGAAAARARRRAAGIGFFLHVPMPSSDLLAALPHHERLFEGAVGLRPGRLPDRARPRALPGLRAPVRPRHA